MNFPNTATRLNECVQVPDAQDIDEVQKSTESLAILAWHTSETSAECPCPSHKRPMANSFVSLRLQLGQTLSI